MPENKVDYNVAKAYEIIKILSRKYGFVFLNNYLHIPGNKFGYWLINPDDPHYRLIRITGKEAAEFKNEEYNVKSIVNSLQKHHGIELPFLDIHLSREKYDSSYEEYDYLNLEYDYTDGVDVHEFYPEIYTAIPEKQVANNIGYAFIEGFKQAKYNVKEKIKNGSFNYVTYGLVGICVLVYIAELILKNRYSESSAYIILGADYKTFTLGLRQLYRLLSNALLHGSFLHLLTNMFSFCIVGCSVERNCSRTKYILLIAVSVLVASLTQDILTENGLLIGLSGGIYGIFTYYIMWMMRYKHLDFRALIPTILINLYLNFLSRTAWLAHIGGLIAGMIIFLIYNNEQKAGPIILLVIVVGFLAVKYATIKTINPFYAATDMEVANIFYEWGFKDYSTKLVGRLLEVYQKYGG